MEIIYFVPRRMNKARIDHLTRIANKSGFFQVTTDIKKSNILVAQDSSGDEVLEFLIKNKTLPPNDVTIESKSFRDVSWFINCMKEGYIVSVEDNQKLQFKQHLPASKQDDGPPSKKARIDKTTDRIPMYACQRSTPLQHHNTQFTDALEVLEEHALYRDDPNSEARALAFRRGSATLKSLPYKITHLGQLKNLPYIDSTNSSKAGHCKKIITEILEEGFSDEVEGVTNSEFFKSMKIFCGIFGVGPSTARKWFYDLNLWTLEDIKEKKLSLTKDQTLGLRYYKDLNKPLLLVEANHIAKLVRETCTALRNGSTVTVVGGFRRGKDKGHDLDLIISHPIEGNEEGMLAMVLEKLDEHFIYTEKKASNTKRQTLSESRSTMDHFEKCFSIFKYRHGGSAKQSQSNILHLKGTWAAKRVDLIVVPKSQFAFAVLGWTGTKHFEREIRRYARSEKKLVLTSHGMYTLDTNESISADSEEEIFEKLGLNFLPPSERCC